MSAAAVITHYPVSNSRFPNAAFSAEEREQLILAHVPQVRHIAWRLRQRLPKSVSIDDLVSTGVLGLMAAIDRFDSQQNVQLTTYAEHKIRGAMLDSLRSLDWAPRQTRKRANQIKKAISALERQLGRAPEEDEIANQLSLTLGEYHSWLAALVGLNLESLETRQAVVSCRVNSDERKVLLNVAISHLPPMERRILHLHCYEEMQSREIAEALGLSESRISQLKSQAILRLSS
jgi:RNA polymerase sigma factor for flagellar operon FliA